MLRSVYLSSLFVFPYLVTVTDSQHITYNEWLPLVLGQDYMEELDIGPITYGYSNRYDPKVKVIYKCIFKFSIFRSLDFHSLIGESNGDKFLCFRRLQIRPYSHPGDARVSNEENNPSMVHTFDASHSNNDTGGPCNNLKVLKAYLGIDD